MARVSLLLWVVACVFALGAGAQTLDRKRLDDLRPLNETEVARLLEGMVAGKPGVSGIRVEDGDFVFHVPGQNVRMELKSLRAHINGLTSAKQRQDAYDEFVRKAEAFISGERRAKSPEEVEKFRKALLPVLKNKSYVAEVAALGRKHGAKGGKLLHIPLIGDIVVVAALDLPKITRFLSVGEGGLYGMSDSDVFRAAMANLEKRVTALELGDYGGVRTLTFGETDYNASIILLPNPWENIPDLPRSVAFTVPTRHILAFADAADPEAMAALRRLSKVPDHGFPVSKLLYRLSERGIEVMP